MKEFARFHAPPLCIEITQDSLKVLRADRGMEFPLEREADGRLTAAGRQKVGASLEQFVRRKKWLPRVRALCGIPLRGVVLRRLRVPRVSGEELVRVLRLQIEAEFPLPPDELAWGWRATQSGSTETEVLILAVRKSLIAEYAHLLQRAGIQPEFTLAALARNAAGPQPEGTHSIVSLAARESELVTFEAGLPAQVRAFADPEQALAAASQLAATKPVLVCGQTEIPAGPWQRLELAVGPGISAATLGLKQLIGNKERWLELKTWPSPSQNQLRLAWDEQRVWLLRAAVLIGLLVTLPWLEPLLLKPYLARKLATFKTEQNRFDSVVAPELRFLQYLKQNQPPYLDAFFIFSQAAPPGFRLDSLNVDQRGDIAFRATLQNPQQMMDFRSKLIDSGFFASIVVEEQTPTPDRQRLNVRVTARWKPAGARPVLKASPRNTAASITLVAGTPSNSPLPNK